MTYPVLRQNSKQNATTELIVHKRRAKKFYNELKMTVITKKRNYSYFVF